jgi:hypothetical protein
VHRVTRLAAGTLAIFVGSAVLVAAPSGPSAECGAPQRARDRLEERAACVELAVNSSGLPKCEPCPLSLAPEHEDADPSSDVAEPSAVPSDAPRFGCTVIDDRGLALGGAVVRRGDEVLATTDGRGGCTFRVEPESDVRLVIAAPGHASRHSNPADWHDLDDDEDPSVVVLPRLAALTGSVVGPDGLPVEGAHVEASPWSLDEASPWEATCDASSISAEATTDASGCYSFEDLDVGEWMVEAKLGGRVGRRAHVMLAPGETATCVALALGATVPLAGCVIDAWSSRVAGATVRFQRLDEPDADESEVEDEPATEPIIDRIVDVVTELSGRFEVKSVAPGRWWIGVLPPPDSPCGPILTVLDVPADGNAAPVLRLVEPTRHLSGFVVDPRGGPAAGLELEFRPDSLLNGGPTWTAVTDRFGRFDVDVPPGLDLHVHGKCAVAPLWAWGDVRADGDAELRLHLSEGGQA